MLYYRMHNILPIMFNVHAFCAEFLAQSMSCAQLHNYYVIILAY
jgi:hypothetical protein